MKRRMPGGGRVAGAHEERVGVAHPALDRLGQLALEAGVDVAEGGRARAAVEVLVGAADGEVDVPLVERDRHRAGRVAEVPEHQRAGVVGDPGELGGVGEPGRAVGDVVDHDERGALADGLAELVGRDAGGGVDLDPAQGQPALGGDALGDVAVGREVVGVDDDLGAGGVRADGVVDGGAHQLVEPDGRRVADRGLAGGGAEGDPAEVVAEGRRQVHPALVPAADQPAAPLLLRRRRSAARPRPRPGDRASCRRSRRGRTPRRRSGRGSGASGSAASSSAAVRGDAVLTPATYRAGPDRTQ